MLKLFSREQQKGDRRFIRYEWVLLALILLLVIFVRTRLLGFPLERDEGEYAYLGQLILQGIPPYSLAYNMKFPGTYFMYALVMSLFGQTPYGIHIGLLITNIFTIVLIYVTGKKLFNSFAGIISCCSYAFLSLSPSVLGFAGHATHFVALWAMGGLLTLLYAFDKDKPYLYFCSGVLFSLAFMMKQPGVFFIVFAIIAIALRYFQDKTSSGKVLFVNAGLFLVGIIAPLVLMVIYLLASGVLEKFWFFTIVYSILYGTQIPLSKAAYVFTLSIPRVMDGFFLIWVLAFSGFIALFFDSVMRGKRIFVILFMLFSFLTVCPGFYFRQHYFITFLPALSLSAGYFISFLSERCLPFIKKGTSALSGNFISKCIAAGIFIIGIAIGMVYQSSYFFREAPTLLCRKIYGANPFPESIEIARFISKNTGASDTIAVIGSEPQIYFYSGRHSATGYIYTYSLMENHAYSLTMQKEMAADIERSKPKCIVFVNILTSWLPRPGSERFILQWAKSYIDEHYKLTGIVDIVSFNETVYRWYDETIHYHPKSDANLFIYTKRTQE